MWYEISKKLPTQIHAQKMQTLGKRHANALQTVIYSRYPFSNFYDLIRGKDKDKDKIDPY